MRVFIVGVTGRTGVLLARDLVGRGDEVRGLVRRESAIGELEAEGIGAVLGDLVDLSVDELRAAFGDADTVVYCAGTEGDDVAATTALDHDAVVTTLAAAGSRRFLLMSAMPEAWRERHLSDALEHYFAVKKRAEIAVARSDADWVVLRPSELADGPGAGRVALGAAEPHEIVARDDVARTLAGLVHRPGIRRRILELTRGDTPIDAALDRVEER